MTNTTTLLAWRNIWRHPRRTLLTIAAMVFADVLLIFMLGLQLGQYRMMIDNSLAIFTGQMQIQADGYNDEPYMYRTIPAADALAEDIRARTQLEAVATRAAELRAGAELRHSLVSVRVGETVVEGRLHGLDASARLLDRFTRVRRKAELAVWVEHLLMNAAQSPELPKQTRLVLRGTQRGPSVVSYDEVSHPDQHLAKLLELYRQSLREPVPLIERASLEYVASLNAGKKKPLSEAKRAYAKQRKWDSRLRYVFGEDDPFDDRAWSDAFVEVAEAVYGPLFEHRSES